DRIAFAHQLAADLVLVVERDLLAAQARLAELDPKRSLASAIDPPLGLVGLEGLDVQADGLARAAVGARGPVQDQALTTIADVEPLAELGGRQRAGRQPHRQAGDPRLEVRAV